MAIRIKIIPSFLSLASVFFVVVSILFRTRPSMEYQNEKKNMTDVVCIIIKRRGGQGGRGGRGAGKKSNS